MRPPTEDIKRMTQDDSQFPLAFRTIIDKNISANELLEFLKSKEEKQKKAPRRSGFVPFKSRVQSPVFRRGQIEKIRAEALRGRFPDSPEREGIGWQQNPANSTSVELRLLGAAATWI